MIKKIDVADLKPKMFIHDINCPWINHPFLRNSFLIESAQDIEKIAAYGICQVYIDTTLGPDMPEAPTVHDINRQLDEHMQHLGRTLKRVPPPVSVEKERVKAKQVCREANRIVHNVLQDCRLGKQVELEQVEPVVSNIIDSIFRNPDAIVSLLRIKQADKYTFQHSVAVGTLLISFCRALDIDRKLIEQVGLGGLLHDIGKMQVPNNILNKPGKLTESEFEIMKNHVRYGCQVLEKTPGISPITLNVAAEHHECYNGSGYPLGLKGDEISLYGQMAAVVDVYDALTSTRVYHTGIEPTEVLRKLLEWSDHHFNLTLVHQFIRSIGIYPVGTLVRLESGYLAVVVEQHHENLLHPRVRVVFNARTRCYTPPADFDLSKPGCNDRITSFEVPAKCGVDPQRYL
ncbi:HD-GYP domain-containing protein [Methylomonas sp. LW13]|uniref:HD-GYP domain-containing protein n=1 Tax=unclassified Methylomonas TaxID=2608980 RepID=UPI00051AC508|nr:HD-GYP domain-containing protein [Methylomonas sp. LW13]QBC29202.1 HD-GYP domain-containing protein [Methylomonas sp. LW13]